VSDIDRNGKRGWRKQNRAGRRLIWLYRAFASATWWSKTATMIFEQEKTQLTWPGSPVIQQVATPSSSSISTAYSLIGTLSPPVIHTSTPLILNGIFHTNYAVADDPFPKWQVEMQNENPRLSLGQKECKGM
jgi:hypothetical protein